ncbi:MAG: hypothetical protein OHK0046_11410 [Anaerolineae bacterium]
MKRLLILLNVLILLLVVPAAAQDTPEPRVLVIALEQEPPTLWPLNVLNVGGYLESIYVRDLWEWDGARSIYPVMVTEIPTVENGGVTTTAEGDTRVEMTLREGLQWSDGTPVTTEDCHIHHTIRSEPATSANVNRGNYPTVVKGFEAVDDRTFAITYAGTFPDVLTANERPLCRYPAHIFAPIIENGGMLEDSDYFTGVQGTVSYGPYRLTQWNIGESFVFEKNPYWNGEDPDFDRLVLPVITDAAQMVNALRNGEVDMTFKWSDDLQPDYASIPDVTTFSVAGISKEALWIRSGPEGSDPARGGDALQDPRVRRAIIHALDRRFYVEQLVGPGIPVPLSWYAEQFQPADLPYLEYDPALARDLLAEAGWVDSNNDGTLDKDGVELDNLRLVTSENPLRMAYQLVIQEALGEVGIGTDIITRPATTFFASFGDRGDLATFQWDLAIFASGGDPLTPTGIPNSYHCDGIPSAENPSGFNSWQFCDPRYDMVDDLISSTPPGPERDALIEEAVERMHEGYFWFGLRLRNTWFAVNTTRVVAETVEANAGTLFTNIFSRIEYWEAA